MPQKSTPYFELRSGAIDALHFVVKTPQLNQLRMELVQRFQATPAFFAGDVVAIDVRHLGANQSISVSKLIAMLSEFKMAPIGIIADPYQAEWAYQVDGFPILESHKRLSSTESKKRNAIHESVQEETTIEFGGTTGGTTIIDKPLRSGQQVYAHGDLVVLDLVSYGAEVMAEGNIHIYAPLRGRALAGVLGKLDARIFCTCLEPELISIAGIYRTGEHAQLTDVQGCSVQVRLSEDKLIFDPLGLK
ncbi:septum site-determining protein MinC [Candidatus Pandoraea novymonadis]|uniref:Probable septum site-determining protein MinC n=1 Tax=Candidatus Pandoraea novymonadis TaxID=1808959 RepID=A0ABX5FF04_9BURK|nr:septum site-determining protein MinC [Candidatus Pandoraea novymonadis]PSB92283.1 Septum site-determining protein MinC [Candidatus Pandoraea novymonadis]